MRQALCNGTVSVCLSVPSVDRCSSVPPAGLLLGAPPAEDIDRQRRPQQLGGQQQMRAVSRCQPTQEAGGGLVR